MAAARAYALSRIPASAGAEAQELARQAALDAIYGMVMLFDGAAPLSVAPDHSAEYVLLAGIRPNQFSEVVEALELVLLHQKLSTPGLVGKGNEYVDHPRTVVTWPSAVRGTGKARCHVQGCYSTH
jgi:hypothetical protein